LFLPQAERQTPKEASIGSDVHIVEDNQGVAASLAVLLEAEGLRPTIHSSADLFLAALPALPPGCVVMDINMAGTDGIAALQKMRARGIDWPVIMMSGAPGELDEDFAWACGAVEFLHKPIEAEALLDVIRNLQASGPR
jgi:two-component system response regulator FixJ